MLARERCGNESRRLLHRGRCARGGDAAAALTRPLPNLLSIVTYHHVADHDPAYPYDPDVADATPAQFRRQMETLARYGTPIGDRRADRARVDGAPLPKNPVMVTFDDGYRSCHDVALPILRAVGIRATFFVATVVHHRAPAVLVGADRARCSAQAQRTTARDHVSRARSSSIARDPQLTRAS